MQEHDRKPQSGNGSSVNAGNASGSKAPAAAPAAKPPQNLSFIVYDSSQVPNHSRRDVRAIAAKSCAAKRKATIERKLAEKAARSNREQRTDAIQPKAPTVTRRRTAASPPVSVRSAPMTDTSSTTDAAGSGWSPTTTETGEVHVLPPTPTSLHARRRSTNITAAYHELPPFESTPIDHLPRNQTLDGGAPGQLYPQLALTPSAERGDRRFLEVLADSLAAQPQTESTFQPWLWEIVMQCGPLYQTLMLIASSHRRPRVPYSILLWLRQDAMRSIMTYVRQVDMADQEKVERALAAMALLANWEHCFGDTEARDMHLEALRQILDKRPTPDMPPAEAQAMKDRLAMLTNAVAQNGAALALLSYKSSFSIVLRTIDEGTTSPLSTRSSIPRGLADLPARHSLDSRIVDSIGQLSTWHVSRPRAGLRLRKIFLQLAAWGPDGTQNFSSNAVTYNEAHAALRLGGLELCVALFEQHCSTLDLDFIPDPEEGKSAPVKEMAAVQPELLVGSPYEDVAIWGATTISAVSGLLPPHFIMGLKLLFNRRHIHRFDQFEAVLSRFTYPRELLRTKCEGVWQIVCSSHNSISIPAG